MGNITDLKITFSEGMKAGHIVHETKFSRPLTAEESSLLPTVNLSRGGNRQYRLDNLANHTDSANWSIPTDGVHTEEAQAKYRNRVRKDVEAAWATFKTRLAEATAKAKVVTEAPMVPVFMSNGD